MNKITKILFFYNKILILISNAQNEFYGHQLVILDVVYTFFFLFLISYDYTSVSLQIIFVLNLTILVLCVFVPFFKFM